MLRAIWGQVRRKVGDVARKVGDVARRYNPIEGTFPGTYGANIAGSVVPLDPDFLSRTRAAGWEIRKAPKSWAAGAGRRKPAPKAGRRPTNETAAAAEAAAAGAGRPGLEIRRAPKSWAGRAGRRKAGPGAGRQQRDFFSALEDDYRALRNIGRNYRAYRNANMGQGRAAWNTVADFFTAVDLPEAERFAAYWRRGLAAGGIGLIGIGVGTRALDTAFNRSRYY